MTSVEPGASAASWRKVARFAARVRYMLTPSEATTAGRAGSNPAAVSFRHHEPSVSKSSPTRCSRSGTP